MARPLRAVPLPMRDGVSASVVAVPPDTWPSVLDFLAQRLPGITRSAWAQRLQQGLVLHDNGDIALPDQACLPGQRLHYYRHLADEPRLPVQASIVFEDEHLLVADKPHFMPVTPSGSYVQQSLLVQLKRLSGCEDLSPIHRIDRETAGLVLFSKRPQDRNAYQALFRDKTIHKVYHAVAAYRPDVPMPRVHTSRMVEDSAQFFKMREVPGEPNSETRIRLLRHEGLKALYELEPITGKRHQLRVHMNALGLPIEGDQFYPEVLRGPDEPEDFKQALQLLAQSVTLTDPLSGERRCFESRLQLSMRAHKLDA